VEKDTALLNFITLIPVNPQKFAKVNNQDAIDFLKVAHLSGQGAEDYPRFWERTNTEASVFPNSKEWRQAQGGKS